MGCNLPSRPRPSMVVMCLPEIVPTSRTQVRMAAPSSNTLQAPHCDSPQPYFVPVRARSSRRTCSSGRDGSVVTVRAWPFTVNWMVWSIPGKQQNARWRELSSTIFPPDFDRLLAELCHNGNMRKRSRVALFSLLIAVSGVVAWVLFSPEVLDPMYKGKALSKWMKEVAYAYYVALDSSANQGNLDEVSEKLDSWAAAVRQSGTNAIPLLLNSIRASDSNLKFKFYGLLERQHFIKVRHIPAEMLNQQAQLGFET